ncbi:PREDICTED: F-box/kelch-repeat protein At3g23880-like [Nicotiana attenuata]|uniref:F-box/kelch-repeat protein At3g23880-like n=1 Tax=Nicotiana attenuata TaxID=49451 RepID=UPI0009053FA6|nr:PREDICTED: F-box/kelch-repeat protein At3g23880-like [Nicotiana attenuata]
MEILSRLPVLSLLQFKCVSKFWKAFISDCYFKMKHLSHAKNDQNSQKFLTSQMCMDKDDMFNFYRSSLSSVQVVEDEQKLDCPSSCKPVNCMLFCCCDGLVLLAVCDRLVEHLLLWNPSTRESILLPHPESPLIDCVFGMGYDATSDDYKILTVNLNRIRPGISAEILALKSGSWRKNGKYPTGSHDVCGFMDCGTDSLAFVHGAFHWLGLSLYYTILSFDISNEVYGEIPLLERMYNIFNQRFIERGVSVLGGMLCFYSTYHNLGPGTFNLWVMKDYGIKESWVPFLKIQDTNLVYSVKPKYMFVDGAVLLCCKHTRLTGSVYRTSRESFKLWPQCSPTKKQGMAYTESLISPKLLI